MARNLTRLAMLGMAVAGPASAATQITLKPISIAHSTNVNATAINRSGTIVGTYTGAKGGFGDAYGFVLSGHEFTKLKPLCHGLKGYCEANPTAINDAGTVVGYWIDGNTVSFVWQNGAYVTGDGANVGGIPFQPDILENRSGAIAFNYNFGGGDYEVYAGPPNAPQQVQGLVTIQSLVNGMNDHGTLAGTTIAVVHGTQQAAIFTGTSGDIKFFAPPGSINVGGGLINNAGQVAGFYVDSSNVSHGFVRQHGKYNYFEFPNGAASVAVNAINKAGRVVGVFTASGVQSAFLFNGKDVTVFGQYPAADGVHLALSDRGEMVLSDYSVSAGAYSSYRGTCSGDGC